MAPTLLFDEVVSLGWGCRSTGAIRDYFGASRAYPFNWWLTPVEGATSFLRDWDLAALYDPARLQVDRTIVTRSYVRHRDYGITFAHEFATLQLGWGPRRHVHILPGWRWRTARPMARTAHLMANFEALDRPGLKVLFVRHLEPEGASLEALEDLRRAAIARAGACEAHFLLITSDGLAAPGWASLAIDDSTEGWAGDKALWARALDSLDYGLAPPTDEASAVAWRKAQGRAHTRRKAREQPAG